MPLGQLTRFRHRRSPLGSVLAQHFVQLIAAGDRLMQERLIQQAQEQGLPGPGHIGRRHGGEAALEEGKRRQCTLLLVGEQPPRVFEHGA